MEYPVKDEDRKGNPSARRRALISLQLQIETGIRKAKRNELLRSLTIINGLQEP